MEIIIEFFETFENTFWDNYGSQIVSLIGILVSAGIAIFLFNRGLKKERERTETNRQIEKNDKKDVYIKNLEGLKSHLIVLLTSIKNATDKQLEQYLSHAFEILRDPSQVPSVSMLTHENLHRLLKINTQQVWELFTHLGLEEKEYINMYARLDYFNTIFEMVHQNIYEGNGQTAIDLMNKIIEIRNSILDISTDYINTVKGQTTEFEKDSLWFFLNNKVLDYYKDNDGIPNCRRDYEKLIVPLRKELIKDEFRFMKVSNDLLKFCKAGGDTYFSITQINKGLAADLIKTAERVQDQNIKVEELLDKIRNL